MYMDQEGMGYGFTYSVLSYFFLFFSFLLCSIYSVLFCSVLFSGLINLTMHVYYYHRYLSFLIVFLLRMKE